MQLDRDNQILALQETNRVKHLCCMQQLLDCLHTVSVELLFSLVVFRFAALIVFVRWLLCHTACKT